MDDEQPVETLSDAEVLALTELKFTVEQDEELSYLLAMNREGDLDDKGQERLAEFMKVYAKGLLRKAEALRIAVERGVREPLSF